MAEDLEVEITVSLETGEDPVILEASEMVPTITWVAVLIKVALVEVEEEEEEVALVEAALAEVTLLMEAIHSHNNTIQGGIVVIKVVPQVDAVMIGLIIKKTACPTKEDFFAFVTVNML